MASKQEKDSKAKQHLASQIIAKIKPTMVTFSQYLISDNYGRLPSSVKESAQGLYAELEKHEKASRSVIDDPSNELPVSSLKDLTKLLADVKRMSALMSGISKSLDNMPSM